MGSKQASIVVDLRTGKNVIHVPDLIAILSAAGYKPDGALKAYGGETLKLAKKAAKEGCGLVIGYGGDGTLNDVVNGVMDAGSTFSSMSAWVLMLPLWHISPSRSSIALAILPLIWQQSKNFPICIHFPLRCRR